MTAILSLEVLECCKCAAPLALSATWVQKARELGNQLQQFWCPYCGVKQGWQDREIDRLRRQIRGLESSLANSREEAAGKSQQVQLLDRRNRALKGVVTRTKKRVGKGVCPCCNRFFKSLHDHMASKHPEYHKP